MSTTLIANEQIDQLIALIKKGGECYLQAGELLVQMVEEDASVYEQIIAQNSAITPQMLDRLWAIGKKQLHPDLLLMRCAGAELAVTLPYKEQVKLLHEPIRIAIKSKGRITVESKNLSELKKCEAELVIKGRKIVDVEDQIKELTNKAPVKVPKRYQINDNGTITFFRDTTFTRGQLEEIMNELPGETAENIQASIVANQIKKK